MLLGFQLSPCARRDVVQLPIWEAPHNFAGRLARQVREYCEGERREFNLDLEPVGTEFQRTVWQELLRIPYGETISYATLAMRIGRPAGASRAVGQANGANPIALIIPCHRVIGTDGTLTGYGGGLPLKQALLEFERRTRGFAEPQLALDRLG